MLIRLVCWLLPSIRGLEVPMRIGELLESVAACQYVRVAERLLRHDFAASTVEDMFWRFVASCGIIFFFELSCHSIVFIVFGDMACVFTTNSAIQGSLASCSSSAISPSASSVASAAAMGGLVESSILLV